MVVELRESGKFYSIYGTDCYIIYYFFGYKINKNRTGNVNNNNVNNNGAVAPALFKSGF